jgi:hypothetical protein
MASKAKTSKHTPLYRFISDNHLLLANSLLPDVLPHIVAIGFTQADIEEKLAKITDLRTLNESKQVHKGYRAAASVDIKNAKAALHKEFMVQLAIARIALAHDTAARVGLALDEKRKRAYGDYVTQGELFCNGLLANADWMAALAARGVTESELQATKAGFKNLRTMAEGLGSKTGAAISATQQRNELYEALKPWLRDYRQMAKIALRKEPQMCEVLGIKQRS